MSERQMLVLGEGQDYEKKIYIERPRGRKAREMMPKVLNFMAKLRDMDQTETDIDSVLTLVNTFWSQEEFENELVPYVLGMDDQEGRVWLNDNGTLAEIMEAFSTAANFLIEQSFSKAEVQAALGKSTDEAQTEAQ